MTVTAYFFKICPPTSWENQTRILKRCWQYATIQGKLNYEFIDPASGSDLEGKLAQQGIQPIMISFAKRSVKATKTFLAAVIKYGEQEEMLPFIQTRLLHGIRSWRRTLNEWPFRISLSLALFRAIANLSLQQLSQLYQSPVCSVQHRNN